MTHDELMQTLRYIADSPAKEHGGFHEQVIQAARQAIETIESLQLANARLEAWQSQASDILVNGESE